MSKTTTNTTVATKFPSPSRGSYFSIRVVYLPERQRLQVSVPFPGILFLNSWTYVDRFKQIIWFPSPSRGSYFSIINCKRSNVSECWVSVPFPGILFLNRTIIKGSSAVKKVSVPFPGILFLNQSSFWRTRQLEKRFRPLPGDLISQSA